MGRQGPVSVYRDVSASVYEGVGVSAYEYVSVRGGCDCQCVWVYECECIGMCGDEARTGLTIVKHLGSIQLLYLRMPCQNTE